MAQSQIRQNFHVENEANLNKQVNMELQASYTYQSMSLYFDRDDVALPGFSKFFKKCADEEREHAEKMMKYQNKRGGRIVLQDVAKPVRESWGTGLEAMQTALEMEKSINQTLIDIHKTCSKHDDMQMTDFLDEFLEEQVASIKEVGEHVTKLKRAGSGLGEYLYDKETLGD